MPTCSICSEVLGADLSAATCGHVYHTDCITNWLKQKPSCPLCKHTLTPQQLTALHFAPKHKLVQLQQQHADTATSDFVSATSSSPFTLHLRVQALRAHLDDLNLLLEQSTDRLTAATTKLDALRQKCSSVTKEWEAVTLQEQQVDAELHAQQQSVDAKLSELKRLQFQHRSAYRQLLALRTLPALRRRRAASAADIHANDLQLMVQQAEATMPVTAAFTDAREEVKSALRDEALCLLLRVQVAEVKAELEELDGKVSELKAQRKRVTELQREEEKLQREVEATKRQVAELEQQKAALLKRESRLRPSRAATDSVKNVPEVEVSAASTSAGTPLRKRKLSQSSPPAADGKEEDDVIVLSD